MKNESEKGDEKKRKGHGKMLEKENNNGKNK